MPEEILETFAAEMRANMLHYSIWGGNYAIVVPKQLRDRLEDAGWSKQHVQQFLLGIRPPRAILVALHQFGAFDQRAGVNLQLVGAKIRVIGFLAVQARCASRPYRGYFRKRT